MVATSKVAGMGGHIHETMEPHPLVSHDKTPNRMSSNCLSRNKQNVRHCRYCTLQHSSQNPASFRSCAPKSVQTTPDVLTRRLPTFALAKISRDWDISTCIVPSTLVFHMSKWDNAYNARSMSFCTDGRPFRSRSKRTRMIVKGDVCDECEVCTWSVSIMLRASFDIWRLGLLLLRGDKLVMCHRIPDIGKVVCKGLPETMQTRRI